MKYIFVHGRPVYRYVSFSLNIGTCEKFRFSVQVNLHVFYENLNLFTYIFMQSVQCIQIIKILIIQSYTRHFFLFFAYETVGRYIFFCTTYLTISDFDITHHIKYSIGIYYIIWIYIYIYIIQRNILEFAEETRQCKRIHMLGYKLQRVYGIIYCVLRKQNLKYYIQVSGYI